MIRDPRSRAAADLERRAAVLRRTLADRRGKTRLNRRPPRRRPPRRRSRPARPPRGRQNAMTIRTFTAGDDAAQVSIYNEAAADLPKFKAVTLDEVRRRCAARTSIRRRASSPSRTAGRSATPPSTPTAGSASPGAARAARQWAEPLLDAVLQEMRRRGMAAAFAAYRADWPAQRDFFLAHGFSAGARDGEFRHGPGGHADAVGPRRDRHRAADAGRRARRARPGAEGVPRPRRGRAGAALLHNPYFPPGVGRRAAQPQRRGAGRPRRAGGEPGLRQPAADRRRHALLPPRRLRHGGHADQARQRPVQLRGRRGPRPQPDRPRPARPRGPALAGHRGRHPGRPGFRRTRRTCCASTSNTSAARGAFPSSSAPWPASASFDERPA